MHGNINLSGNSEILQKQTFSKLPLSIEDQITLLESRGLMIEDKDLAKELLKSNAYYRLSGYMIPFYDKSINTFKEWTTFDDVTALYYFDWELKALLMEALEKIEVDFKTKIINNLSMRYTNAHWFMEESLFITEGAYDNVQRIISRWIKKNRDKAFIKHYFSKYDTPPLPPSRMVFQVLPFWDTSIVFDSLTSGNSNAVARDYGLKFSYLQSWINCLTYLRNLCAHSDRVWNRKMTKNLKIKKFQQYFNEDRDSLFAYIIVISYFLKKICNGSQWIEKLENFIERHKGIDISKMWFPENWKKLLNNIR